MKARRLLHKPVVTPVAPWNILSCEYRAHGRGNHVQSQQRRHQEGHQNEDTGLSCKCTPQKALRPPGSRSLEHRGLGCWLNANKLISWAADMTCLSVNKVQANVEPPPLFGRLFWVATLFKVGSLIYHFQCPKRLTISQLPKRYPADWICGRGPTLTSAPALDTCCFDCFWLSLSDA